MPPTEMSQPSRYPPDDPREWLNRARSNLAQASEGVSNPEVYLEDLCFSAQQAPENALKAVLILEGVRFPRVHDLAQLIGLVEQTSRDLPDELRQAARLTRYAVAARYPSLLEPVTLEQYEQAQHLATAVVAWLEAQIAARDLS